MHVNVKFRGSICKVSGDTNVNFEKKNRFKKNKKI